MDGGGGGGTQPLLGTCLGVTPEAQASARPSPAVVDPTPTFTARGCAGVEKVKRMIANLTYVEMSVVKATAPTDGPRNASTRAVSSMRVGRIRAPPRSRR